MKANISDEDIDIEWMGLILEAQKIGITIEAIRKYLQQHGTHKK